MLKKRNIIHAPCLDIYGCLKAFLCTGREVMCSVDPPVHSCGFHISGGILSQGIMGPPVFA